MPEPDLSLPAIPKGINNGGSSFVMLGADAAGEAFGYTMETSTQPALAEVGINPVPSDWNPSVNHFVLFQHTNSGGWHLIQEALDGSGTPIANFRPTGYYNGGGITQAGQVAPGGSAVIAGTIGANGAPVLLVRDPGGRFTAAPDPSSAVLLPPATLFDPTAPAVAAIDDPGHGGVLVAPASGFAFLPPPPQILHFDGTTWSDEDIRTAPLGQPAPIQRVLAISVTSPSNAYLLAQLTTQAGGIELFKREVVGSVTVWVPVQLSGGEGAAYSATAGAGYTALGPLHPEGASPPVPVSLSAPGAQPLTATPTGAWVDGAFTDASGTVQHFTLNVAVTDQPSGPQGTVHAWCNATTPGMCDQGVPGLPSRFYSSVAWSGGGIYGQRVITGLAGGSLLTLQGASFQTLDGLGDEPQTGDGSAAFLAPTEGWTGGAPPTHFTLNPGADQLQAWPAPFREPLTAIAGEPGKTPGALDAQAIAVGAGGEVARYTPGLGWSAEPLLTAAGVRATPNLRAVAWPSQEFAFAVGDGGQMWRYDTAIGFWQRDPATPLGFVGNLTGVAFDPSNPDRGYAVGLDGVLLDYGKTWTQDVLPAGLQSANFTSITFAGSEAIAAFQTATAAGGSGVSSGLLVNSGSGWQIDTQEQQLVTPPSSAGTPPVPAVSVVSGLPDGGAVGAGDGIVIERDSATAAWRLGRDPLPGYSVVAAAAIRSGPAVQALLSVDPLESLGRWPTPAAVSQPGCATTNSCVGDQGLPTIFAPYDLPSNGWLLRETANGWTDVQHNDYPTDYTSSSAVDNPARDDEVQALLLSPDGTQGWAVGGETGIAATNGLASTNPLASHLHTAGIYRYPAASTPPTGASIAPPSLDASKVTVALGGGAACLAGCASRDPRIGLGPPTWADHAIASAAGLSAQPGGPRAFIYTGGVVPAAMQSLIGTDPAVASEISYFAGHTEAAAGSLPLLPVVSTSEVLGGTPAPGFLQDFARPAGVRGNFPDYYAFDVSQAGANPLRLIVIDDATPSAVQALAGAVATDPQYQFLTGELTSAKAAHIPAIVIGSRTLTTVSVTSDAAPTGASAIAQLLVNDGASAYFFESPASNARYAIPAGAAQTIPSFGTGSLSYQAWANPGNQFGESGYLLASVDTAHVDPVTNRAPVTVRLIPSISELAINALDGTILRRSQIALFSALARRPRSGTGTPSAGALVGPDPYIAIPPNPCFFACSARIDPEYTFTSSHPDIGDFVEHDPASRNARAVFLGPNNKPVADPHSGLFCAYNAGTTTVTVATGGLTFSEDVTVLGGQIRFPCGTTPIVHPPPRYQLGGSLGPPAIAPSTTPPPIKLSVVPPPPPAPAPAPVAHPTPTPLPIASPQVIPFVPRPAAVVGLPAIPLSVPAPPPPPSFPTGFSGVPVPISQPVVQERREEEHATEEAQNFSAYDAAEHRVVYSPELALALAILLAAAGSSLHRTLRTRRRRSPAFAVARRTHFEQRRRRW